MKKIKTFVSVHRIALIIGLSIGLFTARVVDAAPFIEAVLLAIIAPGIAWIALKLIAPDKNTVK